MKRLISISLCLGYFLAIKAQTSQKREIEFFKKIQVSGSVNVTFTQSDTLKLTVVGDDSETNGVYTSVENETLIIKPKQKLMPCGKVYVSGNNLSEITISGASKLTTSNALKTDSLSIETSGASDVKINVETKSLNALVNGASSLVLEGTTQNLHGVLSDASVLKAYKLLASNATITTSGASLAKIFVSEKITANATGASSIKFKGEPKDVNAEASISSSIVKSAGDESSKKPDSKKDSTTFNFKKRKLVIIDKDGDDSDIDINFNNDNDFHHWAGLVWE